MLKDYSIPVMPNNPNTREPDQIKSRTSVVRETTQRTKLNDVIVNMSRLS